MSNRLVVCAACGCHARPVGICPGCGAPVAPTASVPLLGLAALALVGCITPPGSTKDSGDTGGDDTGTSCCTEPPYGVPTDYTYDADSDTDADADTDADSDADTDSGGSATTVFVGGSGGSGSAR